MALASSGRLFYVNNSNLLWHVKGGSGRTPQVSGRLLHYATVCYAVPRSAKLSYAVLLHKTAFRYADLRCASQCHAEKTYASQPPHLCSKMYASPALAARRFAIKRVCLETPDPRSQMCACEPWPPGALISKVYASPPPSRGHRCMPRKP